jgi:hypothetical protein
VDGDGTHEARTIGMKCDVELSSFLRGSLQSKRV